MNERTTIYIEGVDRTGPAVKSATKNFRDLNKEVQKDYEDYKGTLINTRAIRERAKESKFSYAELLANQKKTIDGENALVNKHRQAGQAATQAGQQGGNAFKFMGAQIPPVVGGLARMAGGALTAYEALNQLKQGFMGFAEFDNQLRLTRNQTGLSEQKIHDLGTEMKRLAAITGVSSKELLEAFNEIREAGNFTPEEALKMMPDLTSAANGAGANAKLFNRAVGDIMRNLKIPADQYKYVMEAFSHANREFNINIEEMGPRLSQATAYMATWGYQGVDAAQRAVTLFGILKEGTGSAAKAGSALIGILGDLGNDRMGKALGFGAGQLEKYLRSVQDPIGELISLMTQAENQDLVMKALDIQDKASYTRLMGELRTFADKLKGVREAQGAVAAGKYVEAGPEFAIKRLIVSLEELRNSLGLLLDAIGVTAGIKALAATMTAIATSVERIVGGLKYIVGLSDVMPKGMPKSWAEFKYSQWAKTPQDFGGEGDQPIVPYADYERGGQEYYDKTVKEFEEKLNKEQLEGIAKAKKAREDAADQEREKLDADSRKRFPNYVIPERPRRPGSEPPVGPMTPPHEPSARPRLLPTPLLPTPSPSRPEGMLQKMGSALDDATKKLVSFAEALPDSERAQLVRASFTPRAYGVRMGAGPTSGEGTTGAGTRNIGVETEARRAEEGRTYGGSGDARVLPASYTPSGRGYLWGGPGGARGPGDTGPGGAGPGGLGTDYGPRGSLARGATRGGDGPTGPTGPTTGPAASGKIGERIATAKEAMEDQLRKEGVPEANIKEAANLLAGQALTESKLQPDTSHDSGTGYGIYGARLERRTAMFNWLDKHGYARNSLEGQSRYMAHEAMSGKYKRTRAALMGADPTNRAQNVSTLTSEFENPKDQSEFQMKNRRGWTATATGTPTKGSTPATPVTSTETGSPTSTLPGGTRISSGVGERVHPLTGRRKLHAGTDTPGPAGSEFRSRHGGVVTAINDHGDVTVKNDDGTTSTYRHVAPGVQVGQPVTEGQPLGTLRAKDPRSTGPHLHEEKRDAQGRLLDTAAEDRAKRARQQETARTATPAPRTGSEAATRAPEPAAPASRSQDRDLQLNVKVNDAQVQFARTSMRRSADREVREARWNSYSDIGAA